MFIDSSFNGHYRGHICRERWGAQQFDGKPGCGHADSDTFTIAGYEPEPEPKSVARAQPKRNTYADTADGPDPDAVTISRTDTGDTLKKLPRNLISARKRLLQKEALFAFRIASRVYSVDNTVSIAG